MALLVHVDRSPGIDFNHREPQRKQALFRARSGESSIIPDGLTGTRSQVFVNS
jgi:hypothetical protein